MRTLNPAILSIVTLLAIGACAGDETTGTQRVEIAGETFTLELALTRRAQHRGLSGRDHIPADGGMLFVFPYEEQRYFVMRDCLVPIDIIFLNPAGRVMNSHAMAVEPPDTPERQLKRYPSDGPTSLAIELAGGTVARLGVEPGDTVELPVLELKRRAR
ncbi:MAG: DUF192 domain-containing protein [Planctomycetota bacterium]